MSGKIELVEYKDQKDEWNDFVSNSNNGTIFHNLDFLGYHGDRFKANENHLLFYYKKQNLIATLPMAIFNEDDSRVVKSPYGASYGGFVLSSKGKYNTLNMIYGLVEEFLRYCKVNNINKVIMTLSPSIYYKSHHNYLDFSLQKNDFKILKRELTNVVPMNFSGEPYNFFSASVRRNVKKAQTKGIQIRASEDYKSFYEILLLNRKERHNVAPTHTLQNLIWLKNRIPNNFKLFIAYLEDNPIAAILYFICNSKVVLDFYHCHHPEYEKLRPLSILFNETIKWCKNDRFDYLDLGTSTLNMEPNWGLLDFKESFGSKGIFRDTFIWEEL